MAARRGAYGDTGPDEECKDEQCKLGIRAASDGRVEWGQRRTDEVVVVVGPEVDADGVEDAEGEAPADAVNDDLLAALQERVDDGAEEQEVDEGPVQMW